MSMQEKQSHPRTKMLTQEEIVGLLRVIRSTEGLGSGGPLDGGTFCNNASNGTHSDCTQSFMTAAAYDSNIPGAASPAGEYADESPITDDLGAKANLCHVATEVLLHHFRPLMVRIAKQYAHVGFDEALQEGYLALLRAIHEYDETMGVPFAGYVFSKVRGDVRTAMRRLWRYDARLSYGSHTNDSESDPDNTDDWDKQSASAFVAFGSWDDYDSADIRIVVESAGLSPRERLAVLSMLNGQPSSDLALQESVSTETVKTWRKRALHKLRAALGGEG
ncbi:sigma-70 family RNA polymerase sigma factor [Alicyclobacillus ferrooxydans]|uniref:RNA polymerase sigma factor SigS n=1 Tax=Alicyclobacillus ferrooxydans TaxID=471514 RepID=A0A0P9CAN1_9BACL|nr:sigma-70 family RNA polymerase sigma factor [Alicyclobacillus ferrooxydans]KPV42460.1 hypothetical protein AN477_17925 [Alicyclobacillus ferrooxydans]